jgi:hypothetical protein
VIGGDGLGNEPAFGGDEGAVDGEEGFIDDEKMDEFRVDEFRDDDDSSGEKVFDVEKVSNAPGLCFRATLIGAVVLDVVTVNSLSSCISFDWLASWALFCAAHFARSFFHD